jgi:single-stranded DNA-binding protein
VLVSGELRQERWEKDGQSHSRVVIVAETVEKLLLEKKGGGKAAPSSDGFADDIPF